MQLTLHNLLTITLEDDFSSLILRGRYIVILNKAKRSHKLIKLPAAFKELIELAKSNLTSTTLKEAKPLNRSEWGTREPIRRSNRLRTKTPDREPTIVPEITEIKEIPIDIIPQTGIQEELQTKEAKEVSEVNNTTLINDVHIKEEVKPEISHFKKEWEIRPIKRSLKAKSTLSKDIYDFNLRGKDVAYKVIQKRLSRLAKTMAKPSKSVEKSVMAKSVNLNTEITDEPAELIQTVPISTVKVIQETTKEDTPDLFSELATNYNYKVTYGSNGEEVWTHEKSDKAYDKVTQVTTKEDIPNFFSELATSFNYKVTYGSNGEEVWTHEKSDKSYEISKQSEQVINSDSTTLNRQDIEIILDRRINYKYGLKPIKIKNGDAEHVSNLRATNENKATKLAKLKPSLR